MPDSTKTLARTVSRVILDALLPPQCLACGAGVDRPGNLCPACFGRITFITAPYCHHCGVPLETPAVDDLVCGACLKDPHAFERARAAFVYDGDSRSLVLRLKHGDRTDSAAHLARWMHRSGADLLEQCDAIVPVPLHRWRLLVRTYNQAAMLANVVGRLAGKSVVPDALVRVKATRSQGGLDRVARRRNVAKAFAVRKPRAVSGRRILLIDDVLTTGATADACATALLAAGAKSVNALVLARVRGPADALA